MRKIITLVIMLLFLGMTISSSTGFNLEKQSIQPMSFGNTLYVGGNGTGNYSKIQDAIDNASNGDTVYVYDDSSPYYENLIVDKSINLIGENRDTTTIKYGDWGHIVDISANNVNVSGFTIYYSGDEESGIFIDSCNTKISGNNIVYNADGIYLSDSNNNTIKNNNFSGNWNCISLHSSSGNIIINNTLMENSHGIILEDSCNNTIMGNKIYDDAMCTTLYLYSSSNNNNIKNNTIVWCASIRIRYSNNNTIDGNTVLQCRYGIELSKTSYNTIFCNSLINNHEYGIWSGSYYNEDCGMNLRHSKCYKIYNDNIPNINNNRSHFVYGNNTIYHNNLINNKKNAYDKLNNTWDNDYPSGGNFWSDYNGTDDDGDGIGDTPYPIPGGDNADRYPLMEPYGNWTFSPYARFTWTPSLPYPNETILFNASESIDYDGNITLYEWDWDNDGEYDENHTNHTATHSWLEYGYYPVTLRITDNDNLTDSKTKTVRVGNLPPNEPSLPVPFDGATNVSIVVHLSWVCGDPDGDDVAYDVYFGNTTPPPKVAGNITHDYNPGILDYNTTYYWQIVAWDNWGASTAGSIWSFTTIPARLEVVIVKPVENFFYLRNMRLFPLPRNTIIVGYIDITVNATSDAGIEKVEFYINDKLKETVSEEPYSYRWRVFIPFRYVIKAVAYGNDGNWTSDEIKVWKFF